MTRIAGLTLKKNATGKVTHVTLSVKHYGKILEDIIDAAEIERVKNEPSIPWEVVKQKMDKKHGFKD